MGNIEEGYKEMSKDKVRSLAEKTMNEHDHGFGELAK